MKEIKWEKQIPFLKNTYLLRSTFIAYLVGIVMTSIIISAIFIIDGDAHHLKEIAIPMLGIFALILALMLISAFIVMGPKYGVKYSIDNEGVLITAIKDKGPDIKKIAVLAGILTANPGVAGAGLLVRENIIFIPWNEISEVKVDHPKKRVIIKCSFINQVAVHYPVRLETDVIKAFQRVDFV